MSHARECACKHAGAFLMLENTCMCSTLLSILLLQAVNVEAKSQSQQTAVGLVIPRKNGHQTYSRKLSALESSAGGYKMKMTKLPR